MHQHPDQFVHYFQERVRREGAHVLHRLVAEAVLREQRQAAWCLRRFLWRYRVRNLLFRFLPRLARHWAP